MNVKKSRWGQRLVRLRSLLPVRVNRVIAFGHDLHGEMPVPERVDGLSIRVVGPADLPLVEDLCRIDRREILSRLERGDTCYLASLDDRVCHFSWVQVSGVHVVEDVARSHTVDHGELWIYHCRTGEWARGRRVYPRVLAHILAIHRACGFTSARIYTTVENTPSRRGIARVGFQPRELWRAVKLGPAIRAVQSELLDAPQLPLSPLD